MKFGGYILAAAVSMFVPLWGTETVTVTVGPVGTEPIQFELAAPGVVKTQQGLLYQGDASLATPLGPMVLAQASLEFRYTAGTQNIEAVHGRAFVPTPLSGKQKISIDEPVVAELGYALGENLRELGVPLLDTRGYLYFNFEAGLTIRYGKKDSDDLEEEPEPSFSISFPAGAMARIVVDPLDPMFYFAGSVTTPEGEKNDGGEAEEDEGGIVAGAGSSSQGLIPFRPLVTYGIEDKAREFLGHRVQTGTFPIYQLPGLQVRGVMVTNLDPLATGELAIDPFGIGVGPAIQAGANGRFFYSLDFLHVKGLGNFANVTVPLGKATAAVEITGDRQLAYISGIVDPGLDIGLGLLLSASGELRAAGLVSSDLAESRLLMEGHYKVGMSELANAAGIDFGNLLQVDGSLRADRNGFFVRGQTEAGFVAGPLSSRNSVRVAMGIPSKDAADSFVELEGLLSLAGAGVQGKGRMARDGVTVGGELDVPNWKMRIDGGVQAQPGGGRPMVVGSLSVPDALQVDVQGAVRKVAQDVQKDLDRTLTAFEEATKNFEFELSLRGIRTLVPPMSDAVIREIDKAILANINKRWPKVKTLLGTVEAPGKSAAIRYANGKAEPYRVRLRELKRLMQTADNATARAGLERELQYWIGNPRLRITYKVVGKTITVYDTALLNASQRGQLQAALKGLRALPDASDRKVKAEQAWKLLPKRELLRQVGTAIADGVAAGAPRVESMGFRFPLGEAAWTYQVVLSVQGKRYPVALQLTPDNIASIGVESGKALARLL